MGDVFAIPVVLAGARTSIATFLHVFIYVYTLLVFAYVLSSWIRISYSSPLHRVQEFLREVCEPYLRLFRRVIPPLGPVDVSPMAALLVLVVLDRLIARFV
jgi:YggT family protein